jgi:hypothetical protein
MIAHCDLCGNECKRIFEVRIARKQYFFDSFQCAIQLLAPTCTHCGCRIIGHGLEGDRSVFCSEHCLSEYTPSAGSVVSNVAQSV